MKVPFAASAITAVLAISPASAATMPCTGPNIAKFVAGIDTMPEGPRKMAMVKEIGTANTAMSNGDLRSACRSYIRAQKMAPSRS
jgi:hypothetical protein